PEGPGRPAAVAYRSGRRLVPDAGASSGWRRPTPRGGAPMLRGLTTVSFWADDLAAAKAWYTELLGVEPYFQRPAAGHPAYAAFPLGAYQHALGGIHLRHPPA